ncbi:MAG: 3-methyl-2-oxobutanoate hydroxymethyltransferase [candidate division WOR-3 bacterium]
MEESKPTAKFFLKKKQNKEIVVGITAYNYPIAKIAEECGIDWILVGDSAGNCELGYSSTIPVTMEDMLTFTKGVLKGAKKTPVIVDMPFLSFHTTPHKAVLNAGKFLQLGASGVKVEGVKQKDNIKAIIDAGIPVMGHIGLNPQYFLQIGHKIIGKTEQEIEETVKAAKELEEIGVFAIILEAVTPKLALKVKETCSIPIYGIGAGKNLDGQILVVNDILGLSFGFKPKFSKQYIDLEKMIKKALTKYKEEVKSGKFPGPQHTYNDYIEA